jgi:hypothetical protein
MITLKINGESKTFDAPDDMPLLWVLRDVLGMTGTKFGCGTPSFGEGGETANVLGKKIFQEACVSCHNWTGVSAITPYATITGARAVNDPTATNVAQIVISGTARRSPPDVVSMRPSAAFIPTWKLQRWPTTLRRASAARGPRSTKKM